MTLMAVCGLAHDELMKRIKNGTCPEGHRIGIHEDNLNSHAIVFRNGGVTYCYSNYCKHQCGVCEISFDWLSFDLKLSEKEENYLKSIGWDFLTDKNWVKANSFYPVSHGGSEYYEGTLPVRPFKMFAEEGDIIVYYDYDDGGGKRYYDAPEGFAKRVESEKSARIRKMMVKMNQDKFMQEDEFWTDRFSVVEEHEIEGDSYPYAVIIKHPKNTPFNLLEFTYQKNRFGEFTDIMRNNLTPDELLDVHRKIGMSSYEKMLMKPEVAEALFREKKVYLSCYHPNQEKLELEGVV